MWDIKYLSFDNNVYISVVIMLIVVRERFLSQVKLLILKFHEGLQNLSLFASIGHEDDIYYYINYFLNNSPSMSKNVNIRKRCNSKSECGRSDYIMYFQFFCFKISPFSAQSILYIKKKKTFF